MSGAGPNAQAQPRSLLFVPASDERKLAKSLTSEADLVILDLEDSVALDAKPAARDLARGFLADNASRSERPLLYMRVNDYAGGLIADDLSAVQGAEPDGIMLPKATSGADAARLAADLDALGAAQSIRIIVIATETPAAVLQMHSFTGATPRLAGLTWGAEDLSTAIGASTAHDESGGFTPPFMLARNLCLFAAHAAGVQAIDGITANFRDLAGLEREAKEAARDGFTGKLAIHPAQIAAINAAFTPGPDDIEAFAAQGNAGVISMGGRMLDRPHLERARRLIARAR